MKRFLAFSGSVFVLMWLACMGFFAVALNDEMYFLAQQRAGVTAQTGNFGDEERLLLNRETAVYLAGRGETPQALSERASLHMEDVKKLFDRLRGCMYGFAFAGALLIAASGTKGRRCLPRAYWTEAALAIVAGVCLFRAIPDNFEGLFLRFHEMTFSNDFWQLNPAEDALIRIMPQAFFENMVKYVLAGIGIHWLLGGALISAIYWLTGRKIQA